MELNDPQGLLEPCRARPEHDQRLAVIGRSLAAGEDAQGWCGRPRGV